MYNDILFNVVDEIDHFTLRYRQKGIFECDKANEMIRKYSAYYPEAAALNLKFRTEEEFDTQEMSDDLRSKTWWHKNEYGGGVYLDISCYGCFFSEWIFKSHPSGIISVGKKKCFII